MITNFRSAKGSIAKRVFNKFEKNTAGLVNNFLHSKKVSHAIINIKKKTEHLFKI